MEKEDEQQHPEKQKKHPNPILAITNEGINISSTTKTIIAKSPDMPIFKCHFL